MGCWNKTRGFLLFELLVVIALMVILTGLVGSNSSFLRKALVRAQIEKLHTVCCYLKQLAQVSNKQYVLRFDVDQRSYSYDNMVEILPRHLVFGVAPGILGPPSAPYKLIARGVTFPNNQIIFYPSGIVHAGTVYISDNDYTYTYALSCAVSHFSYIRKYFYVHDWQLLV